MQEIRLALIQYRTGCGSPRTPDRSLIAIGFLCTHAWNPPLYVMWYRGPNRLYKYSGISLTNAEEARSRMLICRVIATGGGSACGSWRLRCWAAAC